ncbi:MAG: SatD family protein, partial [Candidatus Margulisbacteria bacterium]|nr:SatD family protein [Candidatus Margulisiibacteriota bacterium]
MAKKYCVLIGDIVRSRDIEKRKSFQKDFVNLLSKINKKFSSQILSEFTVTLGDEFQGVLRSPADSYEIMAELSELFYPIEVRFGLGWEIITTEIKKKAIGMDGPAFHLARQAIDQAKDSGKLIVYLTRSREKDLALNALTLAILEIKKALTKRQRLAVALYKKHGTQAVAAKAMKVDRTTLAKMLKAAQLENLL